MKARRVDETAKALSLSFLDLCSCALGGLILLMLLLVPTPGEREESEGLPLPREVTVSLPILANGHTTGTVTIDGDSYVWDSEASMPPFKRGRIVINIRNGEKDAVLTYELPEGELSCTVSADLELRQPVEQISEVRSAYKTLLANPSYWSQTSVFHDPAMKAVASIPLEDFSTRVGLPFRVYSYLHPPSRNSVRFGVPLRPTVAITCFSGLFKAEPPSFSGWPATDKYDYGGGIWYQAHETAPDPDTLILKCRIEVDFKFSESEHEPSEVHWRKFEVTCP